MDSQWHYATDGRTHGPVSFDRLRELAHDGTLAVDAEVWSEASPERVSASAVPGLFDADPASAAKSSSPVEVELETIASLDDLQFQLVDANEWQAATSRKKSDGAPVDGTTPAATATATGDDDLDSVVPLDESESMAADGDGSASSPAAESDPAKGEEPGDVAATIQRLSDAAAHAAAVAAFDLATTERRTAFLAANDGLAWCCWVGGVEYGPLASETLFDLVAAGGLKGEDHVRRTDSMTWMSAQTLPGLYAGGPAIEAAKEAESVAKPMAKSPVASDAEAKSPTADDAKPESPASIAEGDSAKCDEKKSPPDSGPPRSPVGKDDDKQKLKPIPSMLGRLAVAAPASGMEAAANATSAPAATTNAAAETKAAESRGTTRSRGFARKRTANTPFGRFVDDLRKRPGLFVLAIVLALVVAWNYAPRPVGQIMEDYEAASALWTEFRAVRERKPSDAEWEAARASLTQQAQTIVARLESRTDSSNVAKQQLIRALRDHFPRMFDDSREKSGESEQRFSTSLGIAGYNIRL